MILIEVCNPTRSQMSEPGSRVMASREIAKKEPTSSGGILKAGDIFDLTKHPDGGSSVMERLNSEFNLHEALALKGLK